MAKAKRARKTADTTEIIGEIEVQVSTKTQRFVDEIKKPFTGFVRDFNLMEQRRAELAGPFMRAANAWMGETGVGFVDFVRFLVPEIGHRAAEYNVHPAYNAARYLKRKAEQVARAERQPETPSQRETRLASAPSPALTAMSRALATIISIVPADQVDKIRQALRTELHWADRRVDSVLKAAVDHQVDPLVVVKAPRGTEIPSLKLSFPPTREEAAEKAAA